MIPLQNTVIYSADSYPNEYWTAVRNTTEWNVVMAEFTRSGNKLQELMLKDLVPSVKDAHVGTHSISFTELRQPSYLMIQVFLIPTHCLRICSRILPCI